MTIDQAVDELAQYAPYLNKAYIRTDRAAFAAARRAAQLATHPDKAGAAGDPEKFKRVEVASAIIERGFGG